MILRASIALRLGRNIHKYRMGRRAVCALTSGHCHLLACFEHQFSGTRWPRTCELNLKDLTVYKIVYSAVDEKPEVQRISLKQMVGASGFEPPTSWSRTRRASQAALRPEILKTTANSLSRITTDRNQSYCAMLQHEEYALSLISAGAVCIRKSFSVGKNEAN